MILLAFLDGQVFVWNAEDWQKLQELRIVGSLIGSLATFPRQGKFPGLPLALLPEEISLLVEIGAARVVRYPNLKCAPNDELKEKFENYFSLIQQEQGEFFRNERKRQVREMIDDIVEGKKCKLLGHPTKKKKAVKSKQEIAGNSSGSQDDLPQSAIIDRDAVLKEELEKIEEKQLDSKDLVIPTFTEAPWTNEIEEIDWLDWVCPRTRLEKLRYMTFKDMWEKEYFLTSGQKFGGDFLMYPGDPRFYHAHFIVVCVENNIMDVSNIIALGRLGNSVRKTVILASFSDDENAVTYQSLQWSSLLNVL